MSYYAAFILSTFIALGLTPVLMRYAVVIGVMDEPNERKVHSSAIPRIGGVAMVLATIIPLLIWLPFESPYIAICCAIMVIFLFGFWDDRKELSYKYKFAGQILAALIVVLGGDLYVRELPFGIEASLSTPLLYVLSVFFLVGITNAMNMTDGLDGLAGGATLLSFGLIAVLSIQSNAPDVLLITVAVVGGVLGFLRFNSHPAVVFMGDTGSQFLGFILGLESIMLTQYGDLTLSKTLPLLILGLPMFDTLIVMALRVKRGLSPFHADKNHIHHRLLGLGLSHFQAVVALYLIQATFVFTAYLIAYSHDLLPLLLFVVYGLLIVLSLWFFENKKIIIPDYLSIKFVKKARVGIKQSAFVEMLAANFAPVLLLSILIIGILLRQDAIPRLTYDVALLSALIVLATIGSFFTRPSDAYYRILLATFSALIVYLGIPLENDDYLIPFGYVDFPVFMGLFLWVLLTLYRGKVPEFKASPFDILIVLLLFVMPIISEVGGGVRVYSFAFARFIILLYVFELLIGMRVIQSKKTCRFFLSFFAFAIAAKYLSI
ncbi:MAG: undecaprenyl/decaprenyl-phosphate alpha-N-acetylglucosaminyl 1-phosphate transferase [Pseudomonadales bacterium]|nr:undecaprenyl/decaprenyl-phosphate alpha-N-acetylglucosaminyl 1-phosphate transferase [Pseudomonadales bacterium]